MDNILTEVSKKIENNLSKATEGAKSDILEREIAIVTEVMGAVLIAKGFTRVFYEECVVIANRFLGTVSSIEGDLTKIILLEKTDDIKVGDEVKRTKKTLEVPVGDALIGRVVNALGKPLDGMGDIITTEKLPAERPAKPIMHRAPVEVPLETGIKIIDALIPVGRGQRELILGDRQTGKSSVAIDAIIHQKGKDVICIYCAIGQRDSSIAGVLDTLKRNGAMDYTIVVKASGNELAGHQFMAPYTATAMAEYFMEHGKDVLIIYDDLSKQAKAYREISLLLERSPGREAYPADIFYIHSRLLERSTRLKPEYGGGSITSLPIIETEAENVSAYIPTNVISITDGQIYLSPLNFNKGLLPAINVGLSVSRVGSKAQLKAYKQVAGKLGIEYSQFEELEMFSKFATKLDEETKRTIDRGQRIREILKQNKSDTVSAEGQVAIILCIKAGIFDMVELKDVKKLEKLIINTIENEYPIIVESIRKNEKLSDEFMKAFTDLIKSKITTEEWKA